MGKLYTEESHTEKVGVFRDREEAGNVLASMMIHYQDGDALILAIPAGGVPVACQVSRSLHLPFDLLIVRKIQLPHTTEAGFGAVGPDGEVIFNEVLRATVRKEHIEKQVDKAKKAVRERENLFRGKKPFPSVTGKSIIVVDDGLASGYTMAEAIGFLKKKGAGRITIAVPTAPRSTVEFLLHQVDELYCPNIRSRYPFAVAQAYKYWYDVPNEEVLDLLDKCEEFS